MRGERVRTRRKERHPTKDNRTREGGREGDNVTVRGLVVRTTSCFQIPLGGPQSRSTVKVLRPPQHCVHNRSTTRNKTLAAHFKIISSSRVCVVARRTTLKPTLWAFVVQRGSVEAVCRPERTQLSYCPNVGECLS